MSRRCATRHPPAHLEQTEAAAIMNALRAAGGNKNRAALSLGIARSTTVVEPNAAKT